MEITGSISPALATLIAALLVFLYSFVNMIVSKDQKTTEFRQAWIDSLRSEVGSLASNLGYLSTKAESYSTKNFSSQETLNEYLEKHGNEILKLADNFHKIQLRIKPKSKDSTEQKFIAKIAEIEKYAQHITELNSRETSEHVGQLVEITRELLKNEWERVKRGEASFFISKYSFLFLFVLALIVSTLVVIGVVEFIPSHSSQFLKT